jgi:hypothetical protein
MKPVPPVSRIIVGIITASAMLVADRFVSGRIPVQGFHKVCEPNYHDILTPAHSLRSRVPAVKCRQGGKRIFWGIGRRSRSIPEGCRAGRQCPKQLLCEIRDFLRQDPVKTLLAKLEK